MKEFSCRAVQQKMGHSGPVTFSEELKLGLRIRLLVDWMLIFSKPNK